MQRVAPVETKLGWRRRLMTPIQMVHRVLPKHALGAQSASQPTAVVWDTPILPPKSDPLLKSLKTAQDLSSRLGGPKQIVLGCAKETGYHHLVHISKTNFEGKRNRKNTYHIHQIADVVMSQVDSVRLLVVPTYTCCSTPCSGSRLPKGELQKARSSSTSVVPKHSEACVHKCYTSCFGLLECN